MLQGKGPAFPDAGDGAGGHDGRRAVHPAVPHGRICAGRARAAHVPALRQALPQPSMDHRQ